MGSEQEHNSECLTERNERLETHLAMLRLDLQDGGQIQRKLLPPCPLVLGDISCDYWLVPSLYLSGDFLDFQRYDERYSVFYFADVSGHGPSSAFVTVLLKYLCNNWLGQWDGQHPEHLPARWLARLNRELLDADIGKHATLFVGVIDRQRRYLHYSLGAQLPMPMLVSEGKLHRLDGEGMPVGLFPGAKYPTLGCALPQSFRLWLCSDGVLECISGDGLATRLEKLERLVLTSDSVAALRGALSLGEASGHDDAAITGWNPEVNGLPDDLTVMTLSGFGDNDA